MSLSSFETLEEYNKKESYENLFKTTDFLE